MDDKQNKLKMQAHFKRVGEEETTREESAHKARVEAEGRVIVQQPQIVKSETQKLADALCYIINQKG